MGASRLPTGCLTTHHRHQVQVWDPETLKCVHVLEQPDSEVYALVAAEGAVWGGVGEEVVVWGRSA